jgi:hypothetical protein
MTLINQKFDLDRFEQALEQIAAGDTTLRLANHIKAEALGGVAALAQLIVTWARTARSDSELQVYAKTLNERAFENFAQSVTGLTALNFASRIRAVQGGAIFERSFSLQAAQPFVEAMHSKSIEELRNFSKTTIPLLCIDNARTLRRPTRLYRDDDTVRDRSEFADLLTECFRVVGRDHYAQRGNWLMDAAARLVYEAFLNTHEHAQLDHRGDLLSRSVRGILVGYRAIDLNLLANTAGEHIPLRNHFSAWRPSHGQMQQAQFMDISVFDSGSGLAQTWLARKGSLDQGIRSDNVSLQTEFDAVTACLRKGGTTKPGDTSGNGLFRILEVVRRAGGYVRIRTGRLSLVKAFRHDAPPLELSDIQMEDAIAGGVPSEPRPWADGTTISVLLPLNRGADR